MLRRLLGVSVLALTACGGGGSTTSAGAGAAPAQVVPGTVASPAPTSGPPSAPQSTAQVTLAMPSQGQPAAHGRSTQFVSPFAGLFRSTVLSVNGSTTLPNGTPAVLTTALSTAADGNCQRPTSSATVFLCTLPIQAPTGTVAYQFDLFDKTGALRLSTASPTFTMPSTGLHVEMQGIVASVSLFALPYLTYGQAGTYSEPSPAGFTAVGQDAIGAIIGGTVPFLEPYTLCDSDTSGHTALVATAPGTPDSAPVRCVTVPGPTTGVKLTYDGAPIPPITITASGASIRAGGMSWTIDAEPRIVLSGTVDEGSRTSSLTFSGPGQTKSFTVSQPRHTGPFGLNNTCGNNAVAIVTADYITFTIYAQASGTCTSIITGLKGTTETIVFKVP